MKYFKNISWLFSENIIRMGVGFFVIIALSRYLGPENFGICSKFCSCFCSF
ncbi:oligosaccharide flippase family protein [Poseidonibacter ostreae]|uniref:Oligosaccharide flippase family protein n=1 Tax=Poseidonibacter ostreae TaxID=2654171 RepID=A0A6L4WR58_9BACT|nr:oligosaccharide flippase family protein [Poseidonibacter ostreae]